MHPHGLVFAAIRCGLTLALTPLAVAVQRMKSKRIFTAFGHAPANRSLDGIEKNQHLLAEASRHWESCPVFWRRGCIPRAWTQHPEISEPALAEEYGPMAHNPSPLHALPRVHGAGDGSGGKQSKDQRCRRCGCGLVIVGSVGSMTPLLTCFGGVNGRQTIVCAELQASLCFLQRTTAPPTAFVMPLLFRNVFVACVQATTLSPVEIKTSGQPSKGP